MSLVPPDPENLVLESPESLVDDVLECATGTNADNEYDWQKALPCEGADRPDHAMPRHQTPRCVPMPWHGCATDKVRRRGINGAYASTVRALEEVPGGFRVKWRGDSVVQGAFADRLRRYLRLREGPFTDEPEELIKVRAAVIKDEISGAADVAARLKEDYVPYCQGRVPYCQGRPTTTKEERQEWDTILRGYGLRREPKGLRIKWQPNYRPSHQGARNEELTKDHRKMPYDYIFTVKTKTQDSVAPSDVHDWARMNAASGKYGIGVDEENPNFKSDAFIVEYLLENPTKDPSDDGKWKLEKAASLGITVGTFETRITRALEKIKAMSEAKANSPRNIDDGVETGERWVSVNLNGWKSYKLDMQTWPDIKDAIRAVQVKLILEATRKKRTGVLSRDTPIIMAATERIEKAFLAARITRRPPWKGVLADLADE